MEDRPITAVILDNHDVISAGVQTWCAQASPPISLVDAHNHVGRVWTGEGGDADVVIYDLGHVREGESDFGELRRLIEKGRRVVVFSGQEDARVMRQCTDLGVKAYITKTEGRDHLVPAVHAAAVDRTYTAPRHAGALVTDDRLDRPRLTPRQIQVLSAWCAGATIPLVALKLGLSDSTVRTHIDRARDRYDEIGRPARSKSLMTVRLIEDGHMTPADMEPPAE